MVVANLLNHFLLLLQLLPLLGSGTKNGLLQGGFLAVDTIFVLKLIALNILLKSGNVVTLLLDF